MCIANGLFYTRIPASLVTSESPSKSGMAHCFSERAETAATELSKDAGAPPTDTFFIALGSKWLSEL